MKRVLADIVEVGCRPGGLLGGGGAGLVVLEVVLVLVRVLVVLLLLALVLLLLLLLPQLCNFPRAGASRA